MEFTKNLSSSLIVFLVALPLCLGIAIASGVSPEKGIISGAIGGVVVGALSGSPLQVSGPANSLIVVVAEAVNTIGLAGLAMAVVMAGMAQIAAGATGLGRLGNIIPVPVTQAMLAGFALIIIASQAHILMDHKPTSAFTQNIKSLPDAWTEVSSAISAGRMHWGFLIGIASTAVLLHWPRFAANAPMWLRKTPPALIVCVVATIAATAFGLELRRVHVPDTLLEDFTLPDLTALSQFTDLRVLEIAITLFILASAESLISASAVDQMAKNHETLFNKELIAQGIGNVICGILGALPVAGVIIRSTANVSSGATNRSSTILHGLWLLTMAALLPFILDDIPMAVLGAILVVGALRLLDLRSFIRRANAAPQQWAVFLITLIGVLFIDVLTGVGVGILTHLVTSHRGVQIMAARTAQNIERLRQRLQWR